MYFSISKPTRRSSAWSRGAMVSISLLASAWLAACGGGGDGGGTAPPPAAVNESAVSTAQSGEVLDYVKRKLAARGPQAAVGQTFADLPVWLTTTTTSSGAATRSGTLVQEAGVDEDDLIKVDDTRIYTLQPLQQHERSDNAFAQLTIHSRNPGGRPQVLGEVKLSNLGNDWVATRGMLLAPELPRLAVVGESTGNFWQFPECPPNMACITALLPWQPTEPRLQVQLLDVSQPQAIATPERLEIDGRLIGTRQIGRMLYLVASHAPNLAYDLLPASATVAERQAALDRLTVADLLPRISVNGGPRQPLVAETDCWLQPANASTQVALTTLTAIDLESPTFARTSRCFVGGTEALYMSPAHVYLATTRHQMQTMANGRLSFAVDTRTDIHKFSIAGAALTYRASGSVNGHLGWDRERTPYRMSEHNGDLRVLSFTGSQGWLTLEDARTQAPSPATLTVLRERSSDASLQTVATLPNAQRPAPIGKPGEQVYAVRFLGDRAYVVTFRQVDPLYVLDLSNPADPRSVGELEVPGFSDWLFPVGDGLLFGVGKDATDQGRVLGVKVALFDVRDAANPKLVHSRNFGGMGSSSALDYSAHGLSLSASGNTIRLALPMLLMPEVFGVPQLTLQRFEVDAAARTLTVRPVIDLGPGWADLGSSRSVQLDNQVHLLQDGRLQTWAW